MISANVPLQGDAGGQRRFHPQKGTSPVHKLSSYNPTQQKKRWNARKTRSTTYGFVYSSVYARTIEQPTT